MVSGWLVTIVVLCVFIILTGGESNARLQRSPDSPSFREVASNKPTNFRIKNTDCVFKLRRGQCEMVYLVSSGTCQLKSTINQLFHDVDIALATSNFIVPEKFIVQKLKINACQRTKENGIITFKAKSSESLELLPRLLSLGPGSSLTLKWIAADKIAPETLAVALKGRTTLGNEQVEMKVEKDSGVDYELTFKMGSLRVEKFFAAFQISIEDMIAPELATEKNTLGLNLLMIKKPKFKGVFSPSGGFEVTATGKIAAPDLAADASQLFVFVQDVKNSGSTADSFGKPSGGIFALYENENVQNTIMSLTGIPVPKIAIFENVNKVAITAATNQIYNINSKNLNRLVGDFVPIEGLDVLPKGLNVLHYASNSNQDIKNKQNKVAEKVLFRCEIGNSHLKWTSPQKIESHLVKFTSLVWSAPKGVMSLKLKPDTNGIFDGIDYHKNTKTVQVHFNLTQHVPVLQNGLVSLLNTTITLYTLHNGQDGYNGWLLKGTGKETILDEMVDVRVNQREHRTNVKAKANIFDMETLRNRTKAECLKPALRKAFLFPQIFPINNLGFEASFEFNKVLKLKGNAHLTGKPNVEILYFIRPSGPQLKVALLFKNTFLHNVVNLFYGEKTMTIEWMRFKTIAVVMKQGGIRGQQYHPFDRNQFEKTDKSFDEGIGFGADRLNLKGCIRQESKMCKFLKAQLKKNANFVYYGQMLKGVMRMHARMQWKVTFGKALEFHCSESHMRVKKDGQRLVFGGNFKIIHTSEVFEGKIYDDGTNILMLEFGGKATDESDKILNLGYAKLRPVWAKFPISGKERIDAIRLRSRLYLGTVLGEQIEFSGGTGRQNIWYKKSTSPIVKFAGSKVRLNHKKIFKAFGVANPSRILTGAAFLNNVVVGYSSSNKEWHVPEFDVIIKKGLHFYGKLTTSAGEIYQSTVNVLDNMQIETIIRLRPLKYGKVTKDKNGKVGFEHVNLFLLEAAGRPEAGPNLIVNGADQRIEGYCETAGLEGNFVARVLKRSETDFDYQLKLRGKIYKETDFTDVLLTTKGEDKPSDFKFKYQVDLTGQANSNVNENLREVFADIIQEAKKGKASAIKVFKETYKILEEYRNRQTDYSQKMESLQSQVYSMDADVDASILDISADCIDQCRTVAIPGIEWQQDCIRQAGGVKNMKCMKWAAEKDKVVNVICLLKCEAKKVVSAGKASENLRKIRTLVNRYRETKIMLENNGKLIDLAREAKSIASSTKQLVTSKLGVGKELKRLLAVEASGNLVDITSLKVDESIENLEPPCLPFQLDFTLNTDAPKSHSGRHKICFNGEFFKNVGVKVVRESFPTIDEMYRVFEEAQLRYSRIDAIKKSLERVLKDTKKDTKRSLVIKSPIDLVDKNLMKIARRRIPKFTVKEDRTTMAFKYYSPWASAKRLHNLESQYHTTDQLKFDMMALKGQAACKQVKSVIAQYKNIADSIDKVAKNYKNGKELYGKHKDTIMKDLSSSHGDLLTLMNETKLSKFEKSDMMYWYEFTKRGMDEYVNEFHTKLANHNSKGLELLKNELESFYGGKNFFDDFQSFGNKALMVSNVEVLKRDKQVTSLNGIGEALKKLLFSKGRTLDDAGQAMGRLNSQILNMQNSALACF